MIIFLDLDDTLWSWHKVPESAKDAIIQAHKNGHKLFVNTGRSKCEVPLEILKDLPFDGFCFSAGSEIIINNKQVFYKPLEVETTKKLIQIIEPLKLGMSLEGSLRTYQNEINYEMFKQFHDEDRIGTGFIVHHKLDEITEEDYAQIMKVSIHSHEIFDPNTILPKLPNDLVFTPFRNMGGEITFRQHNKASAIKFVKEYYGNNIQSMAVGDSENDITMLKEADISVAMGNGNDHVKEISDFTTTEINNDGLYNAFKHFKLI